MAKVKTKYVCSSCGYETNKWLGKCPDCGEFNTFVEEVEYAEKVPKAVSAMARPQRLENIDVAGAERTKTNLSELDRVLSGGIVQGSLSLVGGDPGIGKSTLLLQICQSLGEQGKRILYVSGEESTHQIKLRAQRLGITTENLFLLCETSLTVIESSLNSQDKFDLVIIDSIQTMFCEGISSAPGSVSQVREATAHLMRLSKQGGYSVIIVGHVTKDGMLAGPRVLEHMVDTVLYFEGERQSSYRILRAVKNRFGSTNEIGVFEMSDSGLREISNPSEFMLSGRPLDVPGTVVSCSLEGTRPMLLEVQALVSHSGFGNPRRMATGLDFNRMVLLIAVLEKRMGFQMGVLDAYLNITGGIRITEPAMDCAIACALASSYKNRAIDHGTVVFGEIGLTGELRAVSRAAARVNEAAKLGFKKCILPEASLKEVRDIKNIELVGVKNIAQLLDNI